MEDSISSILILVLLIIMSAYFSATETAYSSLNKIKLKSIANKGNKKAKLALELSEKYDSVISTILIGNNIVNIATASLATVLFTKLLGSSGVTVSTIVMTILILIFGEITPKSFATKTTRNIMATKNRHASGMIRISFFIFAFSNPLKYK